MASGSVILRCPSENYLAAAAKSSDFQGQPSPLPGSEKAISRKPWLAIFLFICLFVY